MPEGPLGFPRLTSIGPLVTDEGDWIEDRLKKAREQGPSEEWTIGPQLADHIWNLTEDTDEVNFGPEPNMLLQALMMFFDDRSESDSLNNWYFTRIEGKEYNDIMTWEKIPSQLQHDNTEEVDNSILYSIDRSPNPVKSTVVSQQYTKHGAMFTYEFKQYIEDEVSGFARVPVPREMSNQVKSALSGDGFEYFEFQNRTFAPQYGDPPEGREDYFHPHFRAVSPSYDQMKRFFTKSFNMMERGVRMEES